MIWGILRCADMQNILVLNSKHVLKLEIYMIMIPANKMIQNEELDSIIVTSN